MSSKTKAFSYIAGASAVFYALFRLCFLFSRFGNIPLSTFILLAPVLVLGIFFFIPKMRVGVLIGTSFFAMMNLYFTLQSADSAMGLIGSVLCPLLFLVLAILAFVRVTAVRYLFYIPFAFRFLCFVYSLCFGSLRLLRIPLFSDAFPVIFYTFSQALTVMCLYLFGGLYLAGTISDYRKNSLALNGRNGAPVPNGNTVFVPNGNTFVPNGNTTFVPNSNASFVPNGAPNVPVARENAPEPTVTCPSCGAVNSVRNTFCISCGQRQIIRRFCTACGAKSDSKAAFCTACGKKFSE